MSFVTEISEKHQSTSLSAFEVKNWQKAFSTEADLIKVNELLTYAIMLGSLIVVYVHFVVMLIELKKVLSVELMCLFV